MANPRKFSEKIAIQRQKQAEETAAFEQIMRDVITATRGNNHATTNKNQHLHINPSVGNCRAESLPDVNRIDASPERNSINLKAALNSLNDMRKGRDPIRRHPSPNASSRSPHHHHISGGHHRSSYNEQRRGGSSPYSPVYLSPPMDTNWRRTNSDSALHQTGLMAEQMGACSPLNQPGSPLSPVAPHSGASSPRRSTVHTVETTTTTFTANSTPSPNSTVNNSANPNDILDPYPMVFTSQNWDPGKSKMLSNQLNHDSLLSASLPNESRPKSCEVPGITIQPTPEDSSSSSSSSSNNNNMNSDNVQHHPSSSLSNTGSLPDLTTLHFPAPLPNPIDPDDQTLNQVNSEMVDAIISESTYSSNNNTSPGSPFTCISSNSYNTSTNTNNTISNSTNSQNPNFSPLPSSPYGQQQQQQQQQNIFSQDTSHSMNSNNLSCSDNTIGMNNNSNHTTNNTNIIGASAPTSCHYSPEEVSVGHHNTFDTKILLSNGINESINDHSDNHQHHQRQHNPQSQHHATSLPSTTHTINRSCLDSDLRQHNSPESIKSCTNSNSNNRHQPLNQQGTNPNFGTGNQQLHINHDTLHQDISNEMGFTTNRNALITTNIKSNHQQQGERDPQASDIHHHQQQQQQQQHHQQQLQQNGNYNEHIRDGSCSTIYLSPVPMDNNTWRRANSDSRLHQTVMMSEQMDSSNSNGPLHHQHHHHQQQQQQQQQNTNHHLHHHSHQSSSQQLLNELTSSRRSTDQTIGTNNLFATTTATLTNNNINGPDIIDTYSSNFQTHHWNLGKKMLNNPLNVNLLPASLPNDSRPKSTGGVPGITIDNLDESSNNIHHLHSHHHQQQHPSFASTGSLPDLTNLPFSQATIDLDQPSLSPVTNTMANTMLTDAYPNASPSPGSPYNCVSSPSYTNQTSTNYSTSSASSFVQQSSIFTQSTFASHNNTNIDTRNSSNLITSNMNTHINTATTTSNIPTDVLMSNQDFSKGNGSTIILPVTNSDPSDLLANEDAFRQSLDSQLEFDIGMLAELS